MQRPCKSGVTAGRREYERRMCDDINLYRAHGAVYPGQITYLRRLGTMTGFLILRARSRVICVIFRPSYNFVRASVTRIRTSRTRTSLGETQKGPGVWQEGWRPLCVHKHVREPLCKFLNTTGPYIHAATCVGVRKIKLVFATNVSLGLRDRSAWINDAERAPRE